MCFFIENDDLVEKYNIIWDKVSADTKSEVASKLVYNKDFLKTKIKSHSNEVVRHIVDDLENSCDDCDDSDEE